MLLKSAAKRRHNFSHGRQPVELIQNSRTSPVGTRQGKNRAVPSLTGLDSVCILDHALTRVARIVALASRAELSNTP